MPTAARDTQVLTDFERDGFALVEDVLQQDQIQRLIRALDEMPQDSTDQRQRRSSFARRDLLSLSAVRDLADSDQLHSIVDSIVGVGARSVRGLLFDKTPDANWIVPWHQDLSIAVQQRIDVEGFGPWSVKAGIVHVQPPAYVLEGMLTVRLHLDDCDEFNGPICMIPGTHRGLLSPDEISYRNATQPRVVCTAKAGDAIIMRPLVLHTSAPAKRPSRRRVIHLEYAAIDLPEGLRWHADG